MKFSFFPLIIITFFEFIAPLLQKTRNLQCPNCPPQISLGSSKNLPVYVPVPVFTLYQIPIIHHYPLNQIVNEITPIPIEIPIEHRINKPYPIPIPVEQKIIIPQPLPYGVKVPIPVPQIDENNQNFTQNNATHTKFNANLNNLVQQGLSGDFENLKLGQNIQGNQQFSVEDLQNLLANPINSTQNWSQFFNKSTEAQQFK